MTDKEEQLSARLKRRPFKAASQGEVLAQARQSGMGDGAKRHVRAGRRVGDPEFHVEFLRRIGGRSGGEHRADAQRR